MALCMALHVYCQHGLFPFASQKGTTHFGAKVLQIFDIYKKMFIFFHFSNKRYNSCKSA